MYWPSIVRTGSLTSTGELLPCPSCAFGSAMQTTGELSAAIDTAGSEVSSTARIADEVWFMIFFPSVRASALV